MKVITTYNGSIKVELHAETADEKHILETMKDKIVVATNIGREGGIVFTLEPAIPLRTATE